MATSADLESLARIAAKLGRQARGARGRRRGPPSLWFLTDPERTPDPVSIARRLPAGTVVVYRAFGSPDALAVARLLRQVTRDRRQYLLIGADPRLAARVGADGVHLPQRLAHLAPRLRHAHPDWLISAAAHDEAALRRAWRWRVDAVLVSAIFPSRSASAGRAVGPLRLSLWAHAAGVPVIALGGVNNKNAPRLLSTGAAGLAAIDGLSGVRT